MTVIKSNIIVSLSQEPADIYLKPCPGMELTNQIYVIERFGGPWAVIEVVL